MSSCMEKPQGVIGCSQTFEKLNTGLEIYLKLLYRKHLRQMAIMLLLKT